MKTTLKIAALFALLCSFVGTASAQCLIPHFSYSTTQKVTVPVYADPSGQQTTITQTAVMTGYSTIGSNCTGIMSAPQVQHWVAMTNKITVNGSVQSVSSASTRNCPTCSYVITSTTAPALTSTNELEEDPSDPTFDLWCSAVGDFQHTGGQGSVVWRLVRKLTESFIANDPGGVGDKNCKLSGPTLKINSCDRPVLPWCSTTVLHPALNVPSINDVALPTVSPAPPTWWRAWDLCVRDTANNTTPWICPNWSRIVSGSNIFRIPPIPLPFALGLYGPPPTPPTQVTTPCDDAYTP